MIYPTKEFYKWFDGKYEPLRPGGRFNTMRKALELTNKFENPTIVETGCARQANDWGAGMSTVLFSDFLQERGSGCLFSVDISARNLDVCRKLTSRFTCNKKLVCSDSAKFLEDLNSSNTINLLYLDSWDYPIIEIADGYAPRDKFPETLEMLKKMGDEKFIELHWERIKDCQEHTVKEIKAAMPMLTEESVVLIDDVNFPGGGKGRLAEKFLVEAGWKEIMREHQSLWVKNV